MFQVFDCEGSFLFNFGSNGEGNGQFNAPTGVAVDRNDNILVADWGNSRIQVRCRILETPVVVCLFLVVTFLGCVNSDAQRGASLQLRITFTISKERIIR